MPGSPMYQMQMLCSCVRTYSVLFQGSPPLNLQALCTSASVRLLVADRATQAALVVAACISLTTPCQFNVPFACSSSKEG